MIGLIFVIVIIGILAAIAIPKLTATRDDAQITAAVANRKTALLNLGNTYTATGAFYTVYSLNDATRDAPCFKFGNGNRGKVSMKVKESGSCGNSAVLAGVKKAAYKAGLTLAGGAKKTHEFGGSRISL